MLKTRRTDEGNGRRTPSELSILPDGEPDIEHGILAVSRRDALAGVANGDQIAFFRY